LFFYINFPVRHVLIRLVSIYFFNYQVLCFPFFYYKFVLVPPRCLEEKYAGPCGANILRYWYNPETNRCEVFLYGGCEANGNHFGSFTECVQTLAILTSDHLYVWIEKNNSTESSTPCNSPIGQECAIRSHLYCHQNGTVDCVPKTGIILSKRTN
uniref:BPTI/Kunitz inhibitor domain-containing protein n=1 Tax=Echinostoma caproni TaxID=27848 RepID=A0A183AWH9_9TREM